jgi:bacillithiol biosynthesis cysteine-adding enzyme BshC
MMFDTYTYPITDTTFINTLIKDYIQGKLPNDILPEYAYNLAHFITHIHQKSQHKQDRNKIVEILNYQNKFYTENDDIQHSIKSLLNDNTFCITTAHQLNIFTGPLYVVYKIITAILLSEALAQQYPDHNFIPIYVLGSEDHDLEEIRHFHLYNKTLSWDTTQTGACGRMHSEGIDALITVLQDILQVQESDIITLLQEAYSKATLAEAQRHLIYKIFEGKKLVVADGDDKGFKSLFIPIMEKDIFQNEPEIWVTKQNQLLKTYNYPLQSHVRTINFFYCKGDIRERIIYENDLYKINNTNILFTKDELLLEIQNHPEYFSPNVILRPLYQQTILPSIAYVGGGGELSYWLQLVALFEHYHVPFPKLILRNSALFVPLHISKKWKKLGFMPVDVFASYTTLKNSYLSVQYDIQDVSPTMQTQIQEIFMPLLTHAQQIDPTLSGWLQAEQQKMFKQADAIVQRLTKSLQQKNNTQLQQIENILKQLFPEQQPQERHESFIWLWHCYGNKTVLDTLFTTFQPMSSDIVVLAEG